MVSEIDSYITIHNFTKAKDDEYCVSKEIELDHLNKKIKTPYKIIEGKHINKTIVDNIAGNIKLPIFESGRYVVQYRTWRRIYYLLQEAEDERIHGLDSFFGIQKNLWDISLTNLSLVFSRNPFKENKFITQKKEDKEKKVVRVLESIDVESYDSLLDYVHTASKALVLSPDIRIKQDETIKLKDYMEFIDNNVKILSDFNKKPIFVPIQIQLTPKRTGKILRHYKEMHYKNIWVNFNATHIGGTYFTRIRTLLRFIDNIMGLSNVTLYFSHIKKETSPNIKDTKAIGSDILSQFFSPDFIGITRNPLQSFDPDERIEKMIAKGEFKTKEGYYEALKLHSSRILDPESYYYYIYDKYPYNLPFGRNILLNSRNINKLLNSLIIYREVERTKKFLEENGVVRPYLKNKVALKENEDVFNNIVGQGSEQAGLFEFLGEL